MPAIVISMDSRKMENPDLDIRYILPDRIEKWSNGAVTDDGYEYIDEDGHILGVWLETEDPEGWWPKIVELLNAERFCGNDLSRSSLVLISEESGAEIGNCRQVWPENRKEEAL